jgi:hypothetical protein
LRRLVIEAHIVNLLFPDERLEAILRSRSMRCGCMARLRRILKHNVRTYGKAKHDSCLSRREFDKIALVYEASVAFAHKPLCYESDIFIVFPEEDSYNTVGHVNAYMEAWLRYNEYTATEPPEFLLECLQLFLLYYTESSRV